MIIKIMRNIYQNVKNYVVQYKNNKNELDIENKNFLNPALFIFLIDQSISMEKGAISITSKALILFLQSLTW